MADSSVDYVVVGAGTAGCILAARLSEALIRSGYCLYAMVPSHQSLEDLFVSLVEPMSDR